MIRDEIITRLAERADATKKDSGIFLDSLLDVITEALKNGETVDLRGFGKFEVKERAERKTKLNGSEHIIPAHNVVKFTVGKTLKDNIGE